MTLVKRIKSKTKSCYLLQTNEQTFLLDYPSEIYGRNLSFPSFSREPKPLKLVVPKVTDDVEHILVTRSDSLGVLFFKKDIPIYITEPVFEQLLMRFERLSNLVVHYEDEDEQGTCVDQVDIARFKKNVVFVRFDERCEFNDVLVVPRSAGTFIGWVNYLIELEDKKTICYLTSLSSKPRFSSEAGSISSDYLIINTDEVSGLHQIDEFSSHVRMLKQSVSIVPVEMTTLLVEIMSHVLCLLQAQENIPVFVVSSTFNHLHTVINLEGDWLSSSFYCMKDPFPIKSYEKLRVVDDLTKMPATDGPMIVFCDPLELGLFPSRLFKNQEIISINNSVPDADLNYTLKLELSSDEIIAGHLGKIIHNLELDEYFYIETSSTHIQLTMDGCSTQVHKNRMYLHGKLEFSDRDSFARRRLSFTQRKCKLNELFGKCRFFTKNGTYYFPDKGIKAVLKGDRVKLMNIKN